MAKPLTRAQALENRAFLKLLRKTGNIPLACRELGLKYGTIQHRRRAHGAFALQCAAAIAFAEARLSSVGTVGPAASRPRCSPLRPARYASSAAPHPPTRSRARVPPSPAAARGEGLYRTAGGEMVIVRSNGGRLQMRRAQPGKLTREAEQAYLAALSATCNKALAAAAVGAAGNAFSRRRRKDPGFAREERMALSEGYQALEMSLLEGWSPCSHEQDDWRNNEPPAIPPMGVNQALQLMYLHQKEALLLDEPDYLKRRRGESRAAHNERLAAMAEERDRREREAFAVAEAERMDAGLPAWGPAGAAVRREGRVSLPDLAQVTGWSKADPAKAPHDPSRALFGGWRLEEMERDAERRGALFEEDARQREETSSPGRRAAQPTRPTSRDSLA